MPRTQTLRRSNIIGMMNGVGPSPSWAAGSIALIFVAAAGHAAITNVQVVGMTVTQAVLSYEAPDANPCRIEASESSSFTPLIHDVDPGLFAGANSDFRPGDLAAGSTRVVVIGKRLADNKALDGKTYSRALQALTLHYFRLTCGSDQAQGTFTTMNIPLGMTYQDPPQEDSDNPGAWIIPTIVEDRNQRIVDPQTGALLKRLSLSSEITNGSNGIFPKDGGFSRVCAHKLQTAPDGAQGYMCVLHNLDQGFGALYFIVPATGETRSLGRVPLPYPTIDDAMHIYGEDSTTHAFNQWTYTGNFTEQISAALSGPVLYSNTPFSQLMKQFEPSFDDSIFGCPSVYAPAGGYAMFVCGRGGQDSYGWLGILYGGDGRPIDPGCTAGNACPRVVAAMNVFTAPETRYCALHNEQMVPDNPLVSINFQELADFNPPGPGFNSLGTAPMATTLATAIDGSQTTITVAGVPKSLATDHGTPIIDPIFQDAAPGDIFYIGQGKQEQITITSVTPLGGGQRSWQVTRGAGGAFPAGTVVWAGCKAGFRMGYWKFLNDSHGTDTTNQNVVIDQYWDGGGHWDAGPLGRVTEGGGAGAWSAVFGRVIDHLNEPLTVGVDDSPAFAGQRGLGYGSTLSKHPSYHQDAAQTSSVEQQWFFDMLPFDGSDDIFSSKAGATPISGQLYRYNQNPDHVGIGRKQMATLASTGGSPLMDISGPATGNVISDQPNDSYKYCVALKAGECRVGSAAGDIFINAKDLQFKTCSGGVGPASYNTDICIGNMPTYAQSAAQLYLSNSQADSTAHSRVLTHGLGGLKSGYWSSTIKALPDASWGLFSVGVGKPWEAIHMWMVKIPPLRADDNVDRSTFLPLILNLTPPTGADAGAITNAVVQFGYEEQGAPDRYFCTSRREVCEAVSATIDPANPFYYRDAEPHGGQACAGGHCTITIPALPMHTVHFQVLFRDSSNAVVTTAQGVSAEMSYRMVNGGSSPSTLSPCDVDKGGSTNVIDVQLEINRALAGGPCASDINADGTCNVIDVQRVANAALGGACVSP